MNQKPVHNVLPDVQEAHGVRVAFNKARYQGYARSHDLSRQVATGRVLRQRASLLRQVVRVSHNRTIRKKLSDRCG